ncbi:MAG: MMPL family transporter [Nevskia sp.]|nr:MMPL family transporter [Nevskia sp.]
MASAPLGPFAQRLLRVVEPLIYGPRARRGLAVFLIATTAALLAQALRLHTDAGFEKSVPLAHPYMQVFQQYQAQFGGADTVLVALERESGEIYDARFLAELKAATDQVFFMPGIFRAHVHSLFTPDVVYYEVVEGGFGGGMRVIPPDYRPTPEMLARIRANVAKAGLIGRLVSRDQHGALIAAEVLDTDPATGQRLDAVRLAHALEDQVRARFASPKKYQYRLKRAVPPFAAGEVVRETFQPPPWDFRWRGFTATKITAEGRSVSVSLRGRDVEVIAADNPQYDPDLKIHIIGFAKLAGEIADAASGVVLFFALALLGTLLALWLDLGSLRLALLPLSCSLAAVVWELGLLKTFGYGLDPFAILVPFLVLAVSTSHGVQYVNFWVDELAQGRGSFEASRETFRRLFVPGTLALLTNLAGFLTIAQVPIGIIREMAVNAGLGMFAVIVANKLTMPLALSALRLRDAEAFRRRLARREARLSALWSRLACVTEKPVAVTLVACSLAILGVSWKLQQGRIVGDVGRAVPELRPDAVYNRDVRAIAANFDLGVDLLTPVAEAEPNSCTDYAALAQIDRFGWRMLNTPGVVELDSIAHWLRQANAAFNDNAIKFQVLPRNQNVLALLNSKITTQSGLLNWDCTAMPVPIYAADHKAETIAALTQAVARYDADNAREFFASHPEVDAADCQAKTVARHRLGAAREAQRRYVEQRHALGVSDERLLQEPAYRAQEQAVAEAAAALAAHRKTCPVHFALGLGNLSVMAATNEVVRESERSTVLWVYAAVALFILLAYRSRAALAAIVVPLFMVSIFCNALMAILGIGLKVATLPVVALGVGIGVDYGIYIYAVLREQLATRALSLRQAYTQTLRRTGKAVVFTGVCLTLGVATWLCSGLQFQRDMGMLLLFMFTANMLGAVVLLPAWLRLLWWRRA